MAALTLTLQQLTDLQERKNNERDGKILRRLICIDLKNKGFLHKDIAEACGVCIDTITDWLQLFDKGSFDALCTLQYEGRRLSQLEPYKKELQQYIDEGNFQRLQDVQEYLRTNYNVETCLSNVWYFCKKNSLLLTKKQD